MPTPSGFARARFPREKCLLLDLKVEASDRVQGAGSVLTPSGFARARFPREKCLLLDLVVVRIEIILTS